MLQAAMLSTASTEPLSNVLIVNRLSSVGTSQFWYAMANVDWPSQCWGVSTGPIRWCWAPRPPSWNLFLFRSMAFTPMACWMSFCQYPRSCALIKCSFNFFEQCKRKQTGNTLKSIFRQSICASCNSSTAHLFAIRAKLSHLPWLYSGFIPKRFCHFVIKLSSWVSVSHLWGSGWM